MPAEKAPEKGGGEAVTELTILLPCLNEAASLPFCIGEAQAFLRESGVCGEVLVADNGSTDGSRELAASLGARVVPVARHGYGAALRGGVAAAEGTYVVMADSDGSYDLYHLGPYLDALRSGAELVVGDRFRGGFEPGASPWSHRRVGVPVLSALGRLVQRRWGGRGGALVHDFHCGLRGVRRESFLRLGAEADGMEFASEMIVLATRAKQRIVQLPAVLRPDRRPGKPHLRPVRDGFRHLGALLRLGARGEIENANTQPEIRKGRNI